MQYKLGRPLTKTYGTIYNKLVAVDRSLQDVDLRLLLRRCFEKAADIHRLSNTAGQIEIFPTIFFGVRMKTTVETTASPSADDLEIIEQRLSAFNDTDVGASQKKSIAVFVRDKDQVIVGGVSGYTAWGWLYIQWLWVDEGHRGQKIASRMLDAAEKEARTRGCHGALIDTFSPIAARAYERHGYKPFGTLPDFPIGRSRVYLQKNL